MSTAGAPGGTAAPLGASFRKQPKRDLAGLRYLVHKRGDPAGDAVALTFDDGPVPRTEKAAEVLEARGARATFFFVGEKVAGREPIVRRMVAVGHEVGNHSYHHQYYPSERDIVSTSALLRGITGAAPRSYRPPFGAIDRPTALAVREAGMSPVSWDVDSEDVFPIFKGLEPEKVYENVVGRVRPGSIVLLHDGSPWSRAVEALPDIVDTLTERGFRMVTVSELIAEQAAAEEQAQAAEPAATPETGVAPEPAAPQTDGPSGRGRPRGWLGRLRARALPPEETPAAAATPAAATGPSSLVADLEALKPKQVVALLAQREPSGARDGADSEGLGLALAARVSLNPAAFARLADSFVELDAAYLRWVIAGLAGAAKRGRALDWDAALTLVEATLPADAGAPPPLEHARRPDWAARSEAAQFVLVTLVRDVLPLEVADRVWSILERLSWDFEGGTDLAGEPARPHEVRVHAMRAIVRFGAWLAAHSDGGLDLSGMPRMREALDAHLDPAREPHEGIWGVYGSELGRLRSLDQGWLDERIGAILPSEPDLWKLRRAAWAGHLLYGSADPELLPLLEDHYRAAIGDLPTPAHLRRGEHSDPGRALVRHVAELYWVGAVDLSSGGLMRSLVERAAPDELAYLIKSLGLWSDRDDLALTDEVRDRLIRLWELVFARAATLGPQESREALERFGTWYALGELDSRWSDDQVIAVVERGILPEPLFRVLERTARRAREDPAAAVDIASQCLGLAPDGWRVYSARESLDTVVAACASAGDPEAKRRGADLEKAVAVRLAAVNGAAGVGHERESESST